MKARNYILKVHEGSQEDVCKERGTKCVAMPDDPDHYKDNLYRSGIKMHFGTTEEMSHFH